METIQPKKENKKEKHRINWKTKFKVAINMYLSIITLKVNELDTPIKRHRMADWIKKAETFNLLPARDSP